MLRESLLCRVFEPENRLSLVVVPTPRRACFPENALSVRNAPERSLAAAGTAGATLGTDVPP